MPSTGSTNSCLGTGPSRWSAVEWRHKRAAFTHSTLTRGLPRRLTLWEHENAYTDSLGTLQPDRNFSAGRASAGGKVTYPFAWSSAVALAPYVGLYSDYYFSMDDAAAIAGLTTLPLLQGWSARATAGLAVAFSNSASMSLGGEYAGIASDTHIWTWRVRGSVPF